MAGEGKTVIAMVQKDVKQAVTKSVAKEAGKAMAKAYVREVQQQLVEGFGADGKKLRRLAKSTIRQKQRILDGKAKRGRGKSARRVPKPRGRFAMTEATQVARLTGQTARDMQATSVTAADNGDNVTANFTFGFKTDRSANVARYLAAGGRDIRGLAPQNTSRGKAARNRILRIGATVIKSKFKQKGIIIDTGSL